MFMVETLSKLGSEIKGESRRVFLMHKAIAQREQLNIDCVILPRMGQAINKQITLYKKA